NTNGSTVTNLAGYTISYGKAANSLTSPVNVTNASLTRYVVEGLASGTYYFAVSAYNSSGARSSLSPVGSKTSNYTCAGAWGRVPHAPRQDRGHFTAQAP